MQETPFAPLPPEKQDDRVPWKPSNAIGRCEESGGHQVVAPSWPPPRKPMDGPTEPPSFMLQCKRCDGWIAVYNDTTPGIKVIKPEMAGKK